MTGRRETSTIPQNGILKGRFIKLKSARELAGRIKFLITEQIRPDLLRYQKFDIISNLIESHHQSPTLVHLYDDDNNTTAFENNLCPASGTEL